VVEPEAENPIHPMVWVDPLLLQDKETREEIGPVATLGLTVVVVVEPEVPVEMALTQQSDPEA
jgi:hypothetical protein